MGAVVALTAISLALSPSLAAIAAPPAVSLGTATAYSVLAGSTVTNTGTSTLQGSLGLHPGTAVTGAPAVGGATNIANGAALQAKADLDTAYTDAAGRAPTGVLAAGIGIQTLTSGVYKAIDSVTLTGTLTLDGQQNANSFFIFQIPGSLTTAPGMTLDLINGAQACNVFWQVGASAKLDTDTTFVGTIMANAQINLLTRATLEGRALAKVEQVTLDTNVITVPGCATEGTGTTPPTGGSNPPTGGSTPPTGGSTPPTGGSTPPTGGSTPPTGGSTPPTGGSTPPTGGSTPPTGGSTPPTGGSTPPTGGSTPPTGGSTPPTGGSTPPTGGSTPPTGGSTPPTGGSTPPTGGSTPPTGGSTPPTGGTTPTTSTAPGVTPRGGTTTSTATAAPAVKNSGGNSGSRGGTSNTLPNTGQSAAPLMIGGFSAAALVAVGIGFLIRARRLRSGR